MSLRQDFHHQISMLENVGVREITPRLISLLKWMDAQAEIKRILDDLRSNNLLTSLVNSGDPQRYAKAAAEAGSPEEVAAVGLAMAELCGAGNRITPLFQIAKQFGVTIRPGSNYVGDYSDAALRRYVEPLLNYVLRRFPEELHPTIAGSLGSPFIPVAIQESLKAFQRDHPNPEKVAFIMMKFGDTTAHAGIEEAVKAIQGKYGYTGLMARDKEYHEDMLPNIQTYMHGCGFGIAVFERIQQENFNPNVSLEVGYMMGLKKRVVFLKDQTLTALQTDLVGRLYRPFDVLDPGTTISRQLEDWMEDKGLI